tara:strand:- start:69942 stop:70703 length:762 start_codon:yes stop_codon:yes gene_type:complete
VLSYLLAIGIAVTGEMGADESICDTTQLIVAQPNVSMHKCFDDYILEYSTTNNIPVQATYILNANVKYDNSPFKQSISEGIGKFNREDAAHVAGFDFAALANNSLVGTNAKERNSELNRLPMVAELNRAGGMWNWLQTYEISMPIKVGRLYSVNGTVTEGNDFKPRAFYKILYQPDIHMAIAYLIPNKIATNAEFPDKYITSISCIEKALGYRLVTNDTVIPDSLKWSKAYSSSVWTDGARLDKKCGHNEEVL